MTEVATLTLTEFLLARIAEDERLIVDEHQPANWCERDEGVHWDAARAHAECEAKRRIVAEHQPFGVMRADKRGGNLSGGRWGDRAPSGRLRPNS